MPTKTLAALVARATAEGLDPLTPALAIARATRPDQSVVASPIGDLPTQIEQASLPGPVLVLLGQVCCEANSTASAVLRQATHRK